jgi:hypothetical protein
MANEIKTICRSCKDEVNIFDLVRKGNTAICIKCAQKTPEEVISELTKRTDEKKEEIVMFCEACKYKFSTIEKPELISKCPYCDTSGYIKKQVTSTDILGEINSLD